MIELILIAILLGSLVALGVMLYRKIPLLVKLPEATVNLRADFVAKVKEGAKRLPRAGTFDHELYLQKVLSKIRILMLKTESKTSNWLEKLRQRNNRKNNHQSDSYWEELKKTKNGR